MMRLLRATPSGIFPLSFCVHITQYPRETIAKICSLGVALVTAIISQTGSGRHRMPDCLRRISLITAVALGCALSAFQILQGVRAPLSLSAGAAARVNGHLID